MNTTACFPSNVAQPTTLPLVLRFGGRWTALRPLRRDDAARLMQFFASHTAETIYDRYGFLMADMSPERAAKLVGVDQSRDAAFGVFEPRHHASLIAVGRYCLAANGRSAELAFVVREDRRCLGIATALLGVLVTTARERGLVRLTAQVQADNAAMIAVFWKAGARFANITGTGAIEATIELAPEDAPTRTSRSISSAPRRSGGMSRKQHVAARTSAADTHAVKLRYAIGRACAG